jgi:hypothetical protein
LEIDKKQKQKPHLQTTPASGENHTWFWLGSHVVLIETTLGFGSNHTWFEVKPRVVFYFIQIQPATFLKPASLSAGKIRLPGLQFMLTLLIPTCCLKHKTNRYKRRSFVA